MLSDYDLESRLGAIARRETDSAQEESNPDSGLRCIVHTASGPGGIDLKRACTSVAFGPDGRLECYAAGRLIMVYARGAWEAVEYPSAWQTSKDALPLILGRAGTRGA